MWSDLRTPHFFVLSRLFAIFVKDIIFEKEFGKGQCHGKNNAIFVADNYS